MQTKPQRNLGVDALRVVTTLMILCLHILNQGGVFGASNAVQAALLTPLRLLCTASVDIYALISGYVLLGSSFRLSRALELWLQVFVLNVALGLGGVLVNPASMDQAFWIRYLFPLTQKAFWYFSAYVGVLAFSPVLNRGIRSLDRPWALALLWGMFLLFSLGSVMGYSNQGDPFGIASGYSVLWLAALYVMGACMRHTGLFSRTPGWRLLLMAALCLGLLCLDSALLNRTDLSEFWQHQKKQLYSYLNPKLTLLSLCLLALFARLRVRGLWTKLIQILAPLTFGIYVIHVHHVIWIPLGNALTGLCRLPAAVLPLAVIGIGIGGFLLCGALDWLRGQFFRHLGLRARLNRMEQWLRRWYFNRLD